jgi:hypothetical protein
LDNEQHDLKEFLEESGDTGGHADSVDITSNCELRHNGDRDPGMAMTDANSGVRIVVRVDGNTGTSGLDFPPNGVPVFLEHLPLSPWAKLKAGIEQKVVS